MGNNHNGCSVGVRRQRAAQRSIRFEIQCGKAIIKQIYFRFFNQRARNGKALWSVNVGSGISAPPITYSVGGKQYVSLLVGWGGAAISLGGGSSMAQYGWGFKGQTRQLLTFALDSRQALPDVGKPSFAKPIVPPDFKPEPHLVDRGQAVYTGSCVWCHSAGASRFALTRSGSHAATPLT